MESPRQASHVFPWRTGNHFQLLVNGEEVFPAMLAALEQARSTVLIEMYLVESGVLFNRFAAVLKDAATRGVKIYLLLDGYGALKLKDDDRQQLKQNNIVCEYYNPLRLSNWQQNLVRDHRKLVVVDNDWAFVGGMGIIDEFDFEANPEHYWHDVAVQISGENVADWVRAFQSTWQYWTRQTLPPGPDDTPEAVKDRGQCGRVVNDRLFGKSLIQKDFIRHALGAEHQVWMMSAYFVPSGRLRRVLRRAARRGVDVRLILPGPISDHPAVRYVGRRYYHSLLSAGVRIFEYQPRFLHGKILLADDWVSIGSNNLDRWNLRWNLEANQEIDDERFAGQTRALFEVDFGLSEECHLDSWQRRSPYHRILEWFWGKMDGLLEVVSQRLRR